MEGEESCSNLARLSFTSEQFDPSFALNSDQFIQTPVNSKVFSNLSKYVDSLNKSASFKSLNWQPSALFDESKKNLQSQKKHDIKRKQSLADAPVEEMHDKTSRKEGQKPLLRADIEALNIEGNASPGLLDIKHKLKHDVTIGTNFSKGYCKDANETSQESCLNDIRGQVADSKRHASKQQERHVVDCRIERLQSMKDSDMPTNEKIAKQKRLRPNVLERMEGFKEGPLSILYDCMHKGLKLKVFTRRHTGLRGVCTGYLLAFDKHMNLAMIDVDELYTIDVRALSSTEQKQIKKQKKASKRNRNRLNRIKREEGKLRIERVDTSHENEATSRLTSQENLGHCLPLKISCLKDTTKEIAELIRNEDDENILSDKQGYGGRYDHLDKLDSSMPKRHFPLVPVSHEECAVASNTGNSEENSPVILDLTHPDPSSNVKIESIYQEACTSADVITKGKKDRQGSRMKVNANEANVSLLFDKKPDQDRISKIAKIHQFCPDPGEHISGRNMPRKVQPYDFILCNKKVSKDHKMIPEHFVPTQQRIAFRRKNTDVNCQFGYFGNITQNMCKYNPEELNATPNFFTVATSRVSFEAHVNPLMPSNGTPVDISKQYNAFKTEVDSNCYEQNHERYLAMNHQGSNTREIQNFVENMQCSNDHCLDKAMIEEKYKEFIDQKLNISEANDQEKETVMELCSKEDKGISTSNSMPKGIVTKSVQGKSPISQYNGWGLRMLDRVLETFSGAQDSSNAPSKVNEIEKDNVLTESNGTCGKNVVLQRTDSRCEAELYISLQSQQKVRLQDEEKLNLEISNKTIENCQGNAVAHHAEKFVEKSNVYGNNHNNTKCMLSIKGSGTKLNYLEMRRMTSSKMNSASSHTVRRRHVNQLFIRGDNIALVAYDQQS